MTTLTLEAVRELMEGCAAVTPGKWLVIEMGDVLDIIGPAKNARVYEFKEHWNVATIEDDGCDVRPMAEIRANAAHIARCSPEFIQALAQGWIEMRAALEAMRPFLATKDQSTQQMVKTIAKRLDGLTPIDVTVTKAQFIAAFEALNAALKGQPS